MIRTLGRKVRTIPHWTEPRSVRVAESKSGVFVTIRPQDNLLCAYEPSPAPELLQKFYASARFTGKTQEDEGAAKEVLGHYSDIQSLNSEDAITWSVFGNLAYASTSVRREVFNSLLESIGATPEDDSPICWLWRRLPHPEKPESSGGPEIDFGFLSKTTLLLGEAKWNSTLGTGQGIGANRSQLFLRALYCDGQARKALPSVEKFIVLGVGRSATVFSGADAELRTQATIAQMSWKQIVQCFPVPDRGNLEAYLDWKIAYSGPLASGTA